MSDTEKVEDKKVEEKPKSTAEADITKYKVPHPSFFAPKPTCDRGHHLLNLSARGVLTGSRGHCQCCYKKARRTHCRGRKSSRFVREG